MPRKTTLLILLAALLAQPVVQPTLATVPSESSYVTSTGNGATTVFTFTFAVTTASSDVKVLLDGVQQSSGYVVALNANQTSAPGGTVTFTVAPANGVAVRIQRTVAVTQPSAFSAYGPYRAKDVEKGLDRIVYQTQQQVRSHQELVDIVGTGNPNANLAQVTATGSTTGRTLADRAGEVANILDFNGCVADGATNCTPALISAAARVGAFGTVRFPGTAASTYYFNSFLPTQFPSVNFDVDPGVTLSTPSDELMSSDAVPLKFSRPTQFYWRALQRSYTTSATSSLDGSDPAPVKDLWIDEQAFDRSAYSPVFCNTAEVIPLKVLWNTSDTWAIDSFAASTAKSFTFTPGSVDNSFHLGMRNVLPGDELMGAFSVEAGAPRLAGFVRTTGGLYGIYASADSAATSLDFAAKTTGVNGTSTALTAPWKGNQGSYAPGRSVWSIRIDGASRASILVNGYVLQSFTTAGGIVAAGFGMYPTTAADSAMIQDVVIARRKRPTYGSVISVRVVGDSRAAPRVDSWPTYLKQALEYTAGIRVANIFNIAVAGQNSAQQLTVLTSAGVADVDVVVIDIGTNDVQGGVAVATFLSNLSSMITLVKAGGKIPVLVNFDLWYGQGQAGVGIGQNSTNYDQGAFYRSALLRLAAEQSVPVVDSPSIVGPVLANYINAGLTPNLTGKGDPAVSDNIHPTSMANRLRAREVAKAIAGALIPRDDAPRAPVVSLDRGDTSQTLTVGTDAQVQRWATALTANRTVTLSTTGAANGDTFRVVRTGLGAFTLDVGGLKTIPSATAAFVDVTYNGSAWVLTGYGAL